MSGIYIEGMEMPTSCRDCPLEQSYDGYNCAINGKSYSWGLPGRPSDCPLIPVPDHGRMGDLDELSKRIDHERFHHTHTDGLAARHHVAEYGHFLKAIADAPTIIPAEGGDAQ